MLQFTSIDNKGMKTHKYQYSRHKSTRSSKLIQLLHAHRGKKMKKNHQKIPKPTNQTKALING